MTFKHMIIIMIFLCFAFSLSSVSASDNADIDNITMVDNEIELEDSKIIENIDELDSENAGALKYPKIYFSMAKAIRLMEIHQIWIFY